MVSGFWMWLKLVGQARFASRWAVGEGLESGRASAFFVSGIRVLRAEGVNGVYRDIPDDLRRLVEPVVEDHGYALMNVENVQGPGAALLRITIDTRSGDGRVPVDQLAAVSREVAAQLDTANAVDGSYRLEVSSPGLDRMLAREEDFVAARGNEVKLKTRRPLDGRRRFRGVLVEFKNGVARVSVEGEEKDIPFEEVEKANIIYAFSSADFNRSRSSGSSD